MSDPCNNHEKKTKNRKKIIIGKRRERDHFGDIGVDGC
jgi:hypothetical protein